MCDDCDEGNMFKTYTICTCCKGLIFPRYFMCSVSSSTDFVTARKDDSKVRQCAKKINIIMNTFKIQGTKLHITQAADSF